MNDEFMTKSLELIKLAKELLSEQSFMVFADLLRKDCGVIIEIGLCGDVGTVGVKVE